MDDSLLRLSTFIIPMVIAITLHEAAHGFAANRLGDSTARDLGRISLNPLRHVDPVGTLLLPGMLALTGAPVFGWAKAVPVNPRNFAHPKRDMAWVAAAGPAMNFALALIAMMLIAAVIQVGPKSQWLAQNLLNFIGINLFLMLLNLLPIPPLDGSKVMIGILPMPLAVPLAKLERHGMLIVIALLVLLPMLIGHNPVGDLVSSATDSVFSIMAGWFGIKT